MEACGRTINLVAFASGRGSNFKSICEAARSKRLRARIAALVTNVPGAPVTEIARSYEVPVIELDHRGKTREEHERGILKALDGIEYDWIVLAGYMRLFTTSFVERLWDESLSAARMINIHPSLLPAFSGKDGYAQAIEYGVKVAGATVHLVGTGLDDGPILMQRSFEVRDDDTAESLMARGLELEHKLYIEALSKLGEGGWKISTGPSQTGRPRMVWPVKRSEQ